MKNYILKNGQVYIGHSFKKVSLLILNGKISLMDPQERPDAKEMDLAGKYVIPGMIDIHTHGAMGVDVNGADEKGLDKIGRFFASNGTTAWLSSVLTDSMDQTFSCLGCLGNYESPQGAADYLGIHMEGPFLSKEYKGAMPEKFLRDADADLVRDYQEKAQGKIRVMTVAPEVKGVLDLIPRLSSYCIVAAIGHSGADYETAMRSIEKGAALVTHTGNAMRPIDRHEPGIFGAALESNISCEMICDGRHLHPGIIRTYLKIKGADHLIGITDSIAAAGLEDGTYRLGVNEVKVKGLDATLPDGTRAGSVLTQIKALQNMISFTGRPLEDVLPIFTENPAKMIGVFDQKGSIDNGKDADLIVLDKDLRIREVFVRGVPVKQG